MRDRPALFVRIDDDDGATGWGEVWCNFPSCGAEHRARLLDSVFAPVLQDRVVTNPVDLFNELTECTAVLALQSGEPGPIRQCIAGIDIALWDLLARRAAQPLWRLLGGCDPRVQVYASGINPDASADFVCALRAQGYRAFKLKIGFGEMRDLENLRAMRSTVGDECLLMVDANQAWVYSTALAIIAKLEQFDLTWIEEPLRADRPWSEWRGLSDTTRIALATGENLAGEGAFAAALESGALRVLQPDLAKWGGISGCLPVARRIIESGARYCPHYLGGGVGLLASAHLLAAVGGDGILEVDANPNPLRSLTCGPLAIVSDGFARLSDSPGLGCSPDDVTLREFAVSQPTR
jgi:L-alanine-DL-glutamate epimerase-like enolase superfamily enzyme